MSLQKLHHIPLEDSNHVLKALHHHLPTCIAFYRRLQFGHFTSTSYILSSLSLEDLQEYAAAPAQQEWIITYLDRSRRPETEVWISGSWELETQCEDGWAKNATDAQRLVRALVTEIQTIGVEGIDAADEDESAVLSTGGVLGNGKGEGKGEGKSASSYANVGRGEYEEHLANHDIVLFGAVHGRTVELLREVGLLSTEFVGADILYRKYLFDVSKDIKHEDSLPSDLVWGKIRPEHFSLVKARTQIPRRDRTLRQLPSLAIFPQNSDMPIAWSFLGPDASLSSLHVEPDYRGRGLAKMLAAKLFVEGHEIFWHGQDYVDNWAHADVAEDNEASNGVCKGLNGRWNYHVLWVRVDASKLLIPIRD